jgi:glycosyltransferase involved in cell wall biosynthesis
MHAGLAIISTDVGGVRMMIQDGESGFVVPNRDLFAFSEKMRTLILDRDLRARFGEKCRERVRSFSVDRMIERTIQVYQSICQN